ncbi:class I SAM-dependent methyltransferase [Horticoccus sp. 23ND18S-11]|uniref:class I SAM-dependent methyltransferase n=1 Tax=Horticoccus sp. 23ND18S-11 TaxID=3391832 RepID=UPI0039C9AB26
MSAPVCRCCGSTDITLRGRKPGDFIRKEFSFYACNACELLFVEPFSGFEIYNDAYYRGQGPDPFVDYETEYRDWRRSDRGLEFADLAGLAAEHVRAGERRKEQGEGQATDRASPSPAPRPLSPALPSPSPSSLLPSPAAHRAAPLRWLDFGCGAGGFLKFLRERGSMAGRPLDLTGHDVGSYADLLQRVDGFRILDLDALRAEPDASYDIISLIEVIEHLPDPSAAIATVARLLKPGGLLLLTTGNLDCAIARRHGIHYRYCAPEIHVSLFNPRCLARLYRRHGLEPKTVRYHGAVKFKVVKSLRHRKVLRAIARGALALPPVVRAVDALYGVSAMPCAVKTS